MTVAGAPVLLVEGLVCRHGDHVAVDGVDLAVRAGEVLALLGPNGAGKSTFAATVAGTRRPDGGRVRVDGTDPAQRGREPGPVGYAPQEIGLYPGLSVLDNLRAFGELSGLRAAVARDRARELARPLLLEPLLSRRAGALSGGERRRVHTAVALVHRPRLVLLDEPTAGADIATRDAILEVVREAADGGAAVVYTTHQLTEVELLEARVAILDRGRVLADGTLADLVGVHGVQAVVLRFDGPTPDHRHLPLAAEPVAGGGALMVQGSDPAEVLAALLPALGDLAGGLVGVEIVRPSLEAVVLDVTGRRPVGEPT